MFNRLSDKQLQVASLVALGKSNKDIASDLFISVHTVRHHITMIMNNTGLENRTQIALEFVKANKKEDHIMPPATAYLLEVSFVDDNGEDKMVRLDISGMPQLKEGEDFSIIKGKYIDSSDIKTGLVDISVIKNSIIDKIYHQLIYREISPSVAIWTLCTYIRLT